MLDFSKNYFELFGLPVTYMVDADSLANHYRELQRVVHPDRYTSGTGQERLLSMQSATLINEAFETLKDPVERAAYLLSMHGIKTEQLNETTHDTSFLMQQIELREELETVAQKNDPFQELLIIKERINKQINSLIAQMAVQLETINQTQLETALDIVRKMRFLRKLYSQAEAQVAKLEDELS